MSVKQVKNLPHYQQVGNTIVFIRIRVEIIIVLMDELTKKLRDQEWILGVLPFSRLEKKRSEPGQDCVCLTSTRSDVAVLSLCLQ